jgi:hypothetical protein
LAAKERRGRKELIPAKAAEPADAVDRHQREPRELGAEVLNHRHGGTKHWRIDSLISKGLNCRTWAGPVGCGFNFLVGLALISLDF